MHVSPDACAATTMMYKKTIQEARNFLSGIDVEGNTIPLYFKCDIEKMAYKITEGKAMCEMCKRSVKTVALQQKYQQMSNNLDLYLQAVNRLSDIFYKD